MQERGTRQDYLSDTLDKIDTLKVCKEELTVLHLVPGLAMKGSYQLQLVHVTLLISDLSPDLLQQPQHLTNVRPPARGIVETPLDHLDERVVIAELAVDLLNVLVSSL